MGRRLDQRIFILLLGFISAFISGFESSGEELSLAISKSARLDLEGIAKGLRDGGPEFVPWPAARMNERREQLNTALDELDALLQRSGEDREEGRELLVRARFLRGFRIVL